MRVIAVSVAVVLLASVVVDAQRRHPVSGRVFAPVMGVGGAGWLERPERENEEAPSKAIEALDFKPGMAVADIGAGSGYYTSRIAKRVGPAGRVYATDIQQGMLDLLSARMTKLRIENVTPVLSEPADPKLPANALDMVLMVDVYHELGAPQTVLGHIRTALKPTGRLVLIEYKGEDPAIPIIPSHKMTVAQAKLEVEHEGFVLASTDSRLPRQHVLTFTKKP